MRMCAFIRFLCPFLVIISCSVSRASDEVGPFVRGLWLVQAHGRSEVIRPENDQRLKGAIFKALGKEAVFTTSGVQGLMDAETFRKLAGTEEVLDSAAVQKVLDHGMPRSRKLLLPKVIDHAHWLTTTFDMIDEAHRQGGDKLVDWIVANYKPSQSLDVTVICTGNSRRSILGSTLGNIAASYYGMPEIRFHSGGTAPSAFNPRTIAALKDIGVEVEATGQEAPRGEPETANPIYLVRWGESGEPATQSTEFSKTYFDASNPQGGFAALMVCGEADAACPVVKGASARISMPYLDPKIYDHSPFESRKYAERRDDIGRLVLCVMMQARNRLNRRTDHGSQ